jgi:hypothetical protein
MMVNAVEAREFKDFQVYCAQKGNKLLPAFEGYRVFMKNREDARINAEKVEKTIRAKVIKEGGSLPALFDAVLGIQQKMEAHFSKKEMQFTV